MQKLNSWGSLKLSADHPARTTTDTLTVPAAVGMNRDWPNHDPFNVQPTQGMASR
jgi:hypothetical protein